MSRRGETDGAVGDGRRAAGGSFDFVRQVQDALAHLHDPAALRAHPLGRHLPLAEAPGSAAPGQQLGQHLREAVGSLSLGPGVPTDSPAWRRHRILVLRYLDGLDAPATQARLALGKTLYYEEHRRAVDAVSALLAERWEVPGPGREARAGADAAGGTPAPRSNLPLPLTSFVGREREMVEIGEALARTRLLTLTGTGGVGKTRLALEAATAVSGDYPDGVFLVSLAPVRDPALLVPAVAQTLGLRGLGSEPTIGQLAAYLRKQRVLLVLDNFEQVVDAAPQVAELLTSCPGLTVLVTSRAPLRVRGEQEWVVAPLPLPAPQHLGRADALAANPAIALFCQRASAVKPGFALTPANARAVAAICARLDGLPLALELAAARIKILPPEGLLARLDRRLAVLTGGARDLPTRQQTLRGTMSWSYELLTAAQRRLFWRLAVFAGGCTAAAADAVCAADGRLGMDLLDGLTALVEQNLIRREDQGGDLEPRFGMLETIREFAQEKLGESGEEEALRRACARYYLGWLEAIPPEQKWLLSHVSLDQQEREFANLRAVLEWCAATGEAELGLRIAAELRMFWVSRGYQAEGRTLLPRLLALPTPTSSGSARVKVLVTLADLSHRPGDTTLMQRYASEALSLARSLGDRAGVALGLWMLACRALLEGDRAVARAHLEEGLAVAREANDRQMTSAMLIVLGDLARIQGDDARARARYEESLAIHGDPHWSLRNLGYVALRAGDLPRALERIEGALAFCREVGYTRGQAECLVPLAEVALARGKPLVAARLLGALDAAYRRLIGGWLHAGDNFEYERTTAVLREELGESAFASAQAEGDAMTLGEAVAYGLEEGT